MDDRQTLALAHPMLNPRLACFASGALLLLLLAACGSTAHPRAVKRSRLTVTVDVRITGPRHSEHRFTLGCSPTTGTLPLAASVCADIAREPAAMLRPLPSRSVCGGTAFGPFLTIKTSWNGHKASFSGEAGCGWPGGTPIAIYLAASDHDARALASLSPRLRCETDPTLRAKPTPWASVVACTHGLWTPRSERLIRLAEQALPLPGLVRGQLFPHDIGARRCHISAGGLGLRILPGDCGVTLVHAWAAPTVSFTEDWALGSAHPRRHVWHITIRDGHATLASQTGPTPPQSIE